MPKVKLKRVTKNTPMNGDFLGNISDYGDGIVLSDKEEKSIGLNTTVEASLPSEIFDTKGMINIGKFKEKYDKINKNSPETIDEKGNIKKMDMVQPYSIKQFGDGKLIVESNSKNPLVKEDFIDKAINSNPRTLRSPKFLILSNTDDNGEILTSEKAKKIIKTAYDQIISNNLTKERADTLNIITVPKEQWENMAIEGEIIKNVFGTYGSNNSTLPEMKNVDLSQQAKLLLELKNGTITKAQFKQRFKLPTSMVIEHPHEKEKLDGKMKSKMVDIDNIEYDILSDKDPDPPNSIGIYNLDNNKIVIKNAHAQVFGYEKDGKGKIVKNKVTKQPVQIIEKELNVGNKINFTDPSILDEIIGFTPNAYSPEYPSDPNIKAIKGKEKRLDHGNIKTYGATSTRVGISSVSKPIPSLEMEKLFYENDELKDWLTKNPKNLEKYANYIERVKDFEDSQSTSTIRCVQGAVPIIRKASPEAWGMTPKQFRCTKDIVTNRLNQIKAKVKEIQAKNKNISTEKATILAKTELNKDPNYKRIVDCDSKEELDIITNIEEENAMKDEDEPLTPEHLLVAERFPTKYGMGDVAYCRTISNISPNSIRYKINDKSSLNKSETIGALAFDEKIPTEEEIEISMKEGTRKKRVYLLKDTVTPIDNKYIKD